MFSCQALPAIVTQRVMMKIPVIQTSYPERYLAVAGKILINLDQNMTGPKLNTARIVLENIGRRSVIIDNNVDPTNSIVSGKILQDKPTREAEAMVEEVETITVAVAEEEMDTTIKTEITTIAVSERRGAISTDRNYNNINKIIIMETSFRII